MHMNGDKLNGRQQMYFSQYAPLLLLYAPTVYLRTILCGICIFPVSMEVRGEQFQSEKWNDTFSYGKIRERLRKNNTRGAPYIFLSTFFLSPAPQCSS